MFLRRKRVRVHLKDDQPSVEGLLASRRRREYLVAVPRLITGDGPVDLSSPLLAIPRSNVAFYEVIDDR